MTDYLTTTVRFADEDLTLIHKDGGVWLTAEQVGKALGLRHPQHGVNKLFRRNRDEFDDGVDFAQLDIGPNLGPRETLRVFSPTGCMLLGMFARTRRAADFRRWAKHLLAASAAEPQAMAQELLAARPLWRAIKHYREFRRWDRRLTNVEIARLTGVSVSTLRRHLRRMEALGLIPRPADYERNRLMITHFRKGEAA